MSDIEEIMYNLMGVLADYEQSGEFDDLSRKTIQDCINKLHRMDMLEKEGFRELLKEMEG
mgnify:CR=1 FL=1